MVEAELWMHPQAHAQLKLLLEKRTPGIQSAVTRSLAVFDALVARCIDSDNAQQAVSQMRPLPLTSIDVPLLTGWPETSDGREMERLHKGAILCVFQVDTLRSSIGILVSDAEIFVVLLAVKVTTTPRNDGFLSDLDAALVNQQLRAELAALIDLTWLEAA